MNGILDHVVELTLDQAIQFLYRLQQQQITLLERRAPVTQPIV